jgi:predicted RNase H-like HicB family nuclease
MAVVTLSAVIHREGDLYVAECPEIGIVSQGKTLEEAVANLKATGLYLEEQDQQATLALAALNW